MVAITDSTKSKSGRISLKEEPIDGYKETGEFDEQHLQEVDVQLQEIHVSVQRISEKQLWCKPGKLCVKMHRSAVRHVMGTAAWLIIAHTTREKNGNYRNVTLSPELKGKKAKVVERARFALHNLACMSTSHTREFTCTWVKTGGLAVVASVCHLSVQRPK